MTQLTVLVADPQRMSALRDGLRLDGRVLRFMSTNLATALESIRTNNPGVVAGIRGVSPAAAPSGAITE